MSSSNGRQTGSIKWYSRLKGYGFIRADFCDGVSELFFHHSAIVPGREPHELSPGVDVEFSLDTDEIGRLKAVQVSRLDGTGWGKVSHHVRDCKDTPPGPAVFCNRCGKWGHMARGCGRVCYECGEIGHIKADCPKKQVPSSPLGSSALRSETSYQREHYGQSDATRGLTGGSDVAGSTAAATTTDDDEDDDDCVILESNPFERKEHLSHTYRISEQKKLSLDFFKLLSEIESHRSCKQEEDSDKEENNDDYLLTENDNEEESDDDCIILEKNPMEEEICETITDMSKKLSLSSDVGAMFSVHQPSHSKLQSLQGGSDHDELVIVAERGQVACRDYPHSRHLCVKHPFKNTPHQTYCNLFFNSWIRSNANFVRKCEDFLSELAPGNQICLTLFCKMEGKSLAPHQKILFTTFMEFIPKTTCPPSQIQIRN